MLIKNIKQSFLFLAMFICLISAGDIHSQIVFGQPAGASAEMIYSSWTVQNGDTEESINQFSIPLGGFVPLRDNFDARFYIGNAFNIMTIDDVDSKLTGISDLRLQFNHSFSEDKFLLSAGINLPTGKKKLDADGERPVLNMLSANYLSFPIRRLGEGFGFNVLVGGATLLGGIKTGASIMYQYNGSYSPYEDVEKYKPGDFISISAGMDKLFKKSSLALNLIYTANMTDKLDGEEVFKQSNNFDFRFNIQHQLNSFNFQSAIRYLLRGKSREYVDVSEYIDTQIYGNEFSLYLRTVYNKPVKWYVAPILELRLIGANDTDFESSNIFGVGAIYGTELIDKINLDVGFKYYFGSADGGDLDITGFQINAGLRAQL